jgi:hypothetical protein
MSSGGSAKLRLGVVDGTSPQLWMGSEGQVVNCPNRSRKVRGRMAAHDGLTLHNL